MKVGIEGREKGRNTRGSSISEFGPALGLLIICFFFPLVDMLAMAVSYGCIMVLNMSQVNEASLLNWTDGTTNASDTVTKTIPGNWVKSGFGQYVRVAGSPQTKVYFRQGQTGTMSGGDQFTDKIVMVKTTVTCNPFLPIPVPGVKAPGLNAPMTFAVSSERTMENPDYAAAQPS